MCSWNRLVILQDLVLAVVINTSAMLLVHAPIDFVTWYPGTCAAFATNVLLQLILPVPTIGQALTKPLADRLARFAFSVFVENAIFVTCISLMMAVLQAGDQPILEVWMQTYVALLFIGYATSLALGACARNRKFVEIVSD